MQPIFNVQFLKDLSAEVGNALVVQTEQVAVTETCHLSRVSRQACLSICRDGHAITVDAVDADEDAAESNQSGADGDENYDDEEGKDDSADFVAVANVCTFPVDLLRVFHLGAEYLQSLALEQVFLFGLFHAAVAGTQNTVVGAAIEHPVITVVVEHVSLRLLVFEVDEG